MPLPSLLLRNAHLADRTESCDIAIADGRIVGLGAGGWQAEREIDLQGKLVLPGFVDAHIHLDKAGLNCRCGHATSLAEAVAAVATLKRGFTVEDVHARAARVIEAAITQGTMHMRGHVEVDGRAGLRSFEAIADLRRSYAFAMDIQICAFVQEGLTNDPEAEPLLLGALARGAEVLGGCPYTDPDPQAQIDRLFALAVDHDIDLDFHLDFDLDPSWTHMDAICAASLRHGWQGRVTIGHATKLSMMEDARLKHYAYLLAEAGVAVIALPATDLYLNGMDQGHRAPRGIAPVHLLSDAGVITGVATNNVMNPFTPYGDCSLMRMANLYANAMHLGAQDFDRCLSMITYGPARMMRLGGYGLAPGDRADLVVFDAPDKSEAFAAIAPPVMGFKAGRQSFVRPAARILR